MMGNRRSTVILLLTLSSLMFASSNTEIAKASEDYWTTMASLPTPYHSIYGTAVVEGKIYFIGYQLNAVYNPETNNWTKMSPPPIFNSGGTVVACQNKIYLLGGSASKPTQVYDPATDTWDNRTSIPSTRNSLQANVVDGRIYVIGGALPSPLGVVYASSSNDVYDPETDSWSKMASIPTPVMGYASAVLDEKIYIIGGGHESGPDYSPINQVQIFDPKTNQWTNGTPIPIGVVYTRACVTTGLSAPKRIYVIGGTTDYYFQPGSAARSSINLNQVYNPETDIWTNATAMPTRRYSLGVALVDDEIYAIGGYNSEEGTVSANEKYTPIGYIPEFPSWIILPIFVTATLSALIIKKKLFPFL